MIFPYIIFDGLLEKQGIFDPIKGIVADEEQKDHSEDYQISMAYSSDDYRSSKENEDGLVYHIEDIEPRVKCDQRDISRFRKEAIDDSSRNYGGSTKDKGNAIKVQTTAYCTDV